MTHTPDRWVVVEITSPEYGAIRKVLAGWFGGYASSDEWQLNSGITEVRDMGDSYEFVGQSGSIYECYKNRYGLSSYLSGIYASMERQLSEMDGCTITIVDEYAPQQNG